MPSEKAPFYDPTPPTYDEALAGSSRWVPPSRSAVDQRGATETEQQSLLRQPGNAGESSRRPNGQYRPPTVETDDEDSLWGSDDDNSATEEDQVRREIEEMDMEEPDRSRSSTWRKRLRIPALNSWKWSWRPRLPRIRINLPSRPAAGENESRNSNSEQETLTRTNRFGFQGAFSNIQIPQVNTMFLVLTFARILALLIILGFFWFLFSSGVFSSFNSPLATGMRFNAEDLRNFLQQRVEPMRMRASVQHYSNYAHLAGTEGDYAAAMDIYAMFNKAGLDRVSVDEYFVYINYPREDGRAVQLMDGEIARWTAKLEEEERHHETSGRQTYAFHAHSKSGDVRGPLIYVNYGSKADYENLRTRDIKMDGAVALIRTGGTEKNTAIKVKLAEMYGFVGCLVYSDPIDDGFSKGDVAPQGRFMPADGVQRGSVSLTNWIVGDVLTPQWHSEEKSPRVKVADAAGLVRIPSLPLAWRDAQVLLQNLKGHGQVMPPAWTGAVPDVDEWWTGDSNSPVVRLQNEQDEIERQKIWNVYGRIEGMETASKSIILGNHRDSMGFGATNPHTGTAVMIELARIFGDLVDRGWKPLRTIEFMSWDASEYNLIGSTEYVERDLENLQKNAYAYIDLSDAVTGTTLSAAGSPVFQRALMHALDRVLDPMANETLKTLWERDNSQLMDLSTGADPSDYIPFQHIAGTSSLHLGFSGESYPYRSSYDTFDLVDQVIDPGFIYHGLMGQVVGLLILDLSDRAILPFDMKRYGEKLKTWLANFENWTKNRLAELGNSQVDLPFDELKDAANIIGEQTEIFAQWEMQWDSAVLASNGWESNEYGAARIKYNDKMALFETALLDPEFGGGVSILSLARGFLV